MARKWALKRLKSRSAWPGSKKNIRRKRRKLLSAMKEGLVKHAKVLEKKIGIRKRRGGK